MSLKLEKIALSLGGQPVIRDVSFELKPGEIVGLLGRNGVGKTSLLRVASGTLQADAGTVRLGDRMLAAWSRREIAQRIAVVPQDLHVPFPFRVGELVLMGRAPYQGWLGFESSADVERAVSAELIHPDGTPGLLSPRLLIWPHGFLVSNAERYTETTACE